MTPGEILLDLLGRQHVLQGIVKGAQARVPSPSGHPAEPQTLARLDSRPRQDDALGEAALQTRGSKGDGQIGLARAGRAYAEDEIVSLERAQARRSASASGQ